MFRGCDGAERVVVYGTLVEYSENNISFKFIFFFIVIYKMNEDMLKIIGILVIVIFLIYLATKSIKLHLNVMEGLSMPSMPSLSSKSSSPLLSSTSEPDSEIAKRAEKIKSDTIKMQDTLLLSKYKTDYENLIVNLDDNFKLMALTYIVREDWDAAAKIFSYIPMLESAMKTIDSA